MTNTTNKHETDYKQTQNAHRHQKQQLNQKAKPTINGKSKAEAQTNT